MNIRYLQLYDLPNLASLNGIEVLQKDTVFVSLKVFGCPRLTDWSALEGMNVSDLQLTGTYTMPNLEGIQPRHLKLDSLDWLEDLSCLNTLDETKYYRFDLLGLDLVTDLSPLRRLHGGELVVSPPLREQAESLVEEGRFQSCTVEYPNSGWNTWNSEVRLQSLEELDTLPLSALKKVTDLQLAGDIVVDPDVFDLNDNWENDEQVYFLRDRETDEEIRVQPGTMQDLTKLGQLTGLRTLKIIAQPIASLEGIDSLQDLEEINLRNCQNLQDISRLFILEKVQDINIYNAPVSSIQGIQNLTSLRSLDLTDTHVTDLSPLAECDFSDAYAQEGLTLCVRSTVQVDDWSPLETIRKFNCVNLDESEFDVWLPHMQSAEVTQLCLERIRRKEATDLSVLGSVKAKSLRLDSIDYLSSLHGLEDLIASGSLQTLEVLGCPRLTDWSALDGGTLPKLWLWSAFSIPDLTNMHIGTLRLERMDWLTDLSPLETLPKEDEINVELVNLENLKDLSALRQLKGNRLAVSENLLQQARTVVNSGAFKSVEIADEDWWGVSNSQFTLTSMEELESLPESVLSMVTQLYMAGDRIYDRSRYNIDDDWNNGHLTMQLHEFETDERTPVERGSMKNLTVFSKLTGLRELILDCQSLTSLAGIENLVSLEKLEIRDAPSLSDVGDLWQMKNLRIIMFQFTDIHSIDGLQNLRQLESLKFYDAIPDISPLAKCDFSHAYQNGGFDLYLETDFDTDLSPLKKIREYSHLQLDNDKIERYLPYVQNAVIHELQLNDMNQGTVTADQLPKVTDRLELHRIPSLTSLDGLKAPGPHTIQLDNMTNLTSVSALKPLIKEGGVRELRVGGCPRVADWSALEGAPLEKLVVYGDLVFLPQSLQSIVERTEGWNEWWQDDVAFSLSSLEELENLPDSALQGVSKLNIAAGELFDSNQFELSENYSNGPQPVLRNRETGEETRLKMPKEADWSFLNHSLPNMKNLTFAVMPVTDLEPLRSLPGMKSLDLRFCTKLKDITALNEMLDLEELLLDSTAVTDLSPLKGKTKYRNLSFNNTKITDFSALAECDFSYAANECGGLCINIDNKNIKDFSFLAACPKYNWMGMGGINPDKWLQHVENVQICGIFFGTCNQKQFQAFIENHPEIENLHIQGTQITDLSMLPALQHLRYVRISPNMKKALASLEGLDYSFELEINN